LILSSQLLQNPPGGKVWKAATWKDLKHRQKRSIKIVLEKGFARM
jgi:hypothetical protein